MLSFTTAPGWAVQFRGVSVPLKDELCVRHVSCCVSVAFILHGIEVLNQTAVAYSGRGLTRDL